LLAKQGSIVMEQLTAEETRKFEDMLFTSQELSEVQMAKPVYKFKVALNDALDHPLKMANKSTNEILEVAWRSCAPYISIRARRCQILPHFMTGTSRFGKL